MSFVAVNSAVVASGLTSVNVANVPDTGLVESRFGFPVAAKEASATVAVPLRVAVLPPSS
jgi:hypothetical protein